MSKVNLDKLQEWIDAGRIDPTKRISINELVESNLIGNPRDGIKVLGRGKEVLRQPIDLLVSRASTSVIEAVEAAGGKVVTRFYTKASIKNLLAGKSENTDKPLPQGAEHVAEVLARSRKSGFLHRLPDPTSRKDMEYYRDPAHRGYLSHTLKAGESPSLYFKVPTEKPGQVEREKKKRAEKSANAMW